MTDEQILAELTQVFRRVFYDDTIVLTPQTTAADIPDWDSMANITVVVEVEQQFGVKFKVAEIESLHDVGALAALVKARIPQVAA